MTEGHLEYFKIKNFKRFDELELDGLGQFNLITGDNNVGKTSLLEALLIDSENWMQTLWNYHRTLNIRGLEINIKSELDTTGAAEIIFPKANYLRYLLKDIKDWLEVSARRFRNRREYEFALEYRKYPSKDFNGNIHLIANHFIRSYYPSPIDTWLHIEEYILGSTRTQPKGFPFLPVFRGYGSDLVDLYSELGKNSQEIEKEINIKMKVLVPQIQGIRIFNEDGVDQIFLQIKGQDKQMPLSQFGDGAVRLFNILLHLVKNKGGRLMIDEVDNGIHHSRMKDFLKNLIKIAAANDVQLFMTTHSLECQQAFSDVFEDPEMMNLQSEFRNITLVEALDHSVKPFIYNYQQLSENLELGIETRGRKLA